MLSACRRPVLGGLVVRGAAFLRSTDRPVSGSANTSVEARSSLGYGSSGKSGRRSLRTVDSLAQPVSSIVQTVAARLPGRPQTLHFDLCVRTELRPRCPAPPTRALSSVLPLRSSQLISCSIAPAASFDRLAGRGSFSGFQYVHVHARPRADRVYGPQRSDVQALVYLGPRVLELGYHLDVPERRPSWIVLLSS